MSEERNARKVYQGKVISDKMEKLLLLRLVLPKTSCLWQTC